MVILLTNILLKWTTILGDNRHNSSDSRFWGFLPENHIVGKAKTILFSMEKSKKNNTIRWKRFFESIK